MRIFTISVLLFVCVTACFAEPEVFWRETPTKRIKLKIDGDKILGRWEYPKEQDKSPTKSRNTKESKSADWSINEQTEQIIKSEAKKAWPDNFQMQAYQIKQQRAAVKTLEEGPPNGIPNEVFRQIRKKAKRSWPRNYKMRAYQEKKQVKAWRELNQ